MTDHKMSRWRRGKRLDRKSKEPNVNFVKRDELQKLHSDNCSDASTCRAHYMFDHIPSVSGIYAIVNKRNGHRYVGQANDMNKRIRRHVRDLDLGTHRTNKDGLLQKAWNEFGPGAFEFIVLEKVSNNWKRSDRDLGRVDNLSLAEHFYVNERSEYNKDKFIVAKKYKSLADAKAWRKPQS